MAVNPYGLVQVTDGGAPRVITGYARETISGGYLVGASGAAGVVSSGADSFVTSDIGVIHCIGSDGTDNFIGIALHNAGSGEPIAVATRGSFILQASGAVIEAGRKVSAAKNDCVVDLAIGISGGMWSMGRAWTCGSENEFIIVDIHG